MINRNIPDSPTYRDSQGVPELISGLTDLCESASFLHPPPRHPAKTKQNKTKQNKTKQKQQKRMSLRRFSRRRYGKSDLTYNYIKREEL